MAPPDLKTDLFLSILAYSQGAWSFEDVKASVDYLMKDMPEGKVYSLKPSLVPPNTPSAH